MKALLLACVASLALAAAPARAAERQIIGAEQDPAAASQGDDCSSFYRTTFTSFEARAHDEERRDFDLAANPQVRVSSAPEGGISIRGWNRPTARLIICRYAVAATLEHANRTLGDIDVTSRNGEISASGPQIDAKQAWWVNMTLYVPRRTTIDVHAGNGGVAIRNMAGRVSATSATGGISVAQSSGTYTIKTDSGGITLDRVTGLINAISRGGAIAFKVAPASTPSIEAKSGEGRILCTLKGCGAAVKAANGSNRVRIGDRAPDVHLSTSAGSIWIGPVTY